MLKLLFVCTHNRCRSILAEAMCRHVAGDVITAASAGSEPAGVVHPLTLRFLEEAGIATEGLRSKSWDELEDFAPDVVITVCDRAAGEACPLWMGRAQRVHWGLADPSSDTHDADRTALAFHRTLAILRNRLELLAATLRRGAGRDVVLAQLRLLADHEPTPGEAA